MMDFNSIMAKLDGQLSVKELRMFAKSKLAEWTGIPDWTVKFHHPDFTVTDSHTLEQWRDKGTMSANPNDGGLKVLEDA